MEELVEEAGCKDLMTEPRNGVTMATVPAGLRSVELAEGSDLVTET